MSNPYRVLADAVIMQAVADYRELKIFLQTHNPDDCLPWSGHCAGQELHALERFFLGKRFRTLTRINGRAVLDKLREEEKKPEGRVYINKQYDYFMRKKPSRKGG
ncbi:MAG: hypothetical protein PHZ09_14220 [Eubacteriales bacterium]|nr:hypothetical protein [Eubacteriales bacterium]